MRLRIDDKKIYLKTLARKKALELLFERMESLGKKPESLLSDQISFKKTQFLFETLRDLASENITDVYFLYILEQLYPFFSWKTLKETN